MAYHLLKRGRPRSAPWVVAREALRCIPIFRSPNVQAIFVPRGKTKRNEYTSRLKYP